MIINENISFSDFPYICRCCLYSKKDMQSIFEALIPEMFIRCTNIELQINHNLPVNICIQCLQMLNRFYSFVSQCERAENLVKKIEEQRKDDSSLNGGTSSCYENGLNVYDSEFIVPEVILSVPMPPEDFSHQQILGIPPDNIFVETIEDEIAVLPLSRTEKTSEGLPEANFENPNHCLVEHTTLSCSSQTADVASKQVQEQGELLICTICHEMLGSSQSLLLHVRAEHAGIPDSTVQIHACDGCSKRFASKFALRTHQKSHEEQLQQLLTGHLVAKTINRFKKKQLRQNHS